MKILKILALAAVVLSFFAVSVAAGDQSIKIAEKQGIGSYLTDGKGMALYWFKKDSPGKSDCTGPCLANWPLFYSEEITYPAGLSADDFGTITRDDGAKQTTFRGFPLYYWIGDREAGETTGNMMGSVWFVIDPAAFPVQ